MQSELSLFKKYHRFVIAGLLAGRRPNQHQLSTRRRTPTPGRPN